MTSSLLVMSRSRGLQEVKAVRPMSDCVTSTEAAAGARVEL